MNHSMRCGVTDQEKKQQRVSLGIELEDAQVELAYLREKAFQIADRLDEITNRIRVNATRKPSRADFDSDIEMENRLGPEHQSVLSFEETGKLIEDLRAARKKLYNLSERKSQLSSGDFTMTI